MMEITFKTDIKKLKNRLGIEQGPVRGLLLGHLGHSINPLKLSGDYVPRA